MDDRQLIKDALEYRSGEDSCIAVYMGSMATHGVYVALGLRMGFTKSGDLDKALNNASPETLAIVKATCQHTINYMLEHPVTRCKECSQIIPVNK